MPFENFVLLQTDIAFQEDFYAVGDPGVGKSLIYCTVVGIFFWILLFCLEYQVFSKMTVNIRQAIATASMSVSPSTRFTDEGLSGTQAIFEFFCAKVPAKETLSISNSIGFFIMFLGRGYLSYCFD